MLSYRGRRGRPSGLLTGLLGTTLGIAMMSGAQAQTRTEPPAPSQAPAAAGTNGAAAQAAATPGTAGATTQAVGPTTAAQGGAQTTAQTTAKGTSQAAAALPAMTIHGGRSAYQAEFVHSDQFTQPILDMAQSVSVIPKKVLDEQQAQSLQDILRNVPGITFTSGEGNLGWGDMFTIRGFSSEQSFTVDGIRDAGLASRMDTFDTESVEVFKGTGTIESGVAAPGGSVNLVTKEAHLGDAYHLQGSLGSASYRRVTADLNKQLGDNTALRLNLMRHTNDVDGRAVTHYDRWGVAGSLAMGLGTPTTVTIDYLHQHDDNVPDGGIPIQRGTGGAPMPGVARNAWYGDPNLYTDRTETNRVTVKVAHDVNDNVHLSNITRWEQTDRVTVLSPARFNSTAGTSLGYVGSGPLITSGSGVLSYSGFAPAPIAGGQAVLRGNNFGTAKRYDILANETNLNLAFDTGHVHHDVVAGAEFYHERYGDLTSVVDGPAFNPVMSLANPYGTSMGSVPTLEGGAGDYAAVNDGGVYLRDTVTLTSKWIVDGAIRYDRFSVRQVNGAAGAHTVQRSNDGAWSGRAGLTYKPVPYGSLYASYSQATQPSAVGGTTNNVIYGDTTSQSVKPATAKTWEVGTKWDLFERRLSLTGALFRTELSDSWDYGDSTTTVVRELPPKRVDGIELGLSGNLTEKWTAFAGFAGMRGRITKGANAGARPGNVPNATFNLWTSYQLTPKLALSYGVQYVGTRRYTDNAYVGGQNNNSSTVNGPNGKHPVYVADNEKAPAFWLHSLAARYEVDKHLTLSLNVQNLFNKFYYSAIGASLDGYQIYGVPGAGRTVILSADLKF
ncbi:TonB-dependent siderophore receptor [Burkholderia gladioli pv. gladioli]|uniref:TonB-dependent siderophore receptor family protein n=1 Tax=Burkholderia gladioli TaxID=28095 RepID=A0AAW3F2I6_BURGA|nr:TonB-dependent siderophore receptor [Burkholderia gladioli]AJW94363.1 TonB-dependent siderophore receptor family protein [Burkholderia gladioli]KGC13960.1 TonB-dependent siderophore receptor family protein [Burkholderia gladioli]MDJ1166316.1 TonB-dependent siderophore receptor [Burkholderia gladioli pv. gladioli]SPU84193.1 TonB-dependent siderophore receptor [Burkholderia gladioli]